MSNLDLMHKDDTLVWTQINPPYLGDLEQSKADSGTAFNWTVTDSGSDFGHYRIIHRAGYRTGGGCEIFRNQLWFLWWATHVQTSRFSPSIAKTVVVGGKVSQETQEAGEEIFASPLIQPIN